jgi:uncharacterized membrane protein
MTAGKPEIPFMSPSSESLAGLPGQPVRPPEDVLFQAVTMPHRSLSRRALILLLGIICALSAVTSAVCIWGGAWPVGGFALAACLLLAWFFRLNVLAARAREMILLSEDALRVIRVDPKGRRSETTLPPAWLTVRLQEELGRVPKLLLATRGVQQEIGQSLGEAEKRDLAAALQQALHRWRHPDFDNPQLRDGV